MMLSCSKTLLKSSSSIRSSSLLYTLHNITRSLSETAATPATLEKQQTTTINLVDRKLLSESLKPKEVVNELDKYIIGQTEAKKAVAIAFRNRWRRQQLSYDLKNDVIPKNILMVGPTGCGKTEIARRVAKLSQAPFIKVEATKFTEVGFHGKDVDQIIKDLLDISINMTRKRIKDELKADVAIAVEERLLDYLSISKGNLAVANNEELRENNRLLLRQGNLEGKLIDIHLPPGGKSGGGGGDDRNITIDVSNPSAIQDIIKASKGGGIISMFAGAKGGKNEKKKMTIAEARPLLEEQEAERLLDDYDVIKEAIVAVEESGIVFIDEIDKLVNSSEYRSADASSEGVQRDLLPLIEGCSISTKHGNVNTDFILFIASGAFHSSKPSDLLAELQGRLPIRVSLTALTENDLYRILTEPVTNLLRQQIELLKTEELVLSFTDDAIKEIAKIAFEINKSVENIGARRLHTIIERIVEEISFTAADKTPGEQIVIDDVYVKGKVADLMKRVDLFKYII